MSKTRGGRRRPARTQPSSARRQPGGARPQRAGTRGQPESTQTPDVHVEGGVRLQKVLAGAGMGSRRACEQLIAAGRVEVDGVVVRELGVRVDPHRAVVHVDGLRVQLDSSLVTLALNKPLGVVSTMHDPEGRPSLDQFVASREERLFHVGRLDADSEGLLLLTNDGELAHRLAHPRYQVAKTYLVEVAGRVKPSLVATLRQGVQLEDGPVAADSARLVDSTPRQALLELTLHEGRNRVVRRMLDEVGLPVTRLLRTRIGPVHLGDLRPGRTRVLGRIELGSLMKEVEL